MTNAPNHERRMGEHKDHALIAMRDGDWPVASEMEIEELKRAVAKVDQAVKEQTKVIKRLNARRDALLDALTFHTHRVRPGTEVISTDPRPRGNGGKLYRCTAIQIHSRDPARRPAIKAVVMTKAGVWAEKETYLATQWTHPEEYVNHES